MTENTGYLQIFVRTAGESLPVTGAEVLIEGNGVTRRLTTDRSGKTERIPLEAPPARSSTEAGNPDPFAVYRVTVKKEGFYTQTTEKVPLFAGVGSLQPVTLIGLAEYGGDRLKPQSSTDTVGDDPQALNR